MPLRLEVEGLGGALGDVDDAVAVIGAAIVHPHDDRATVLEVGDARVARQRHRGVGRGDGIAVEDLAVRGQRPWKSTPYQEARPSRV